MPYGDLEGLLNKGSGLKGICGANDMREILQMANRAEPQAQLALELYCYRVKKYLGAYFAVLGRVDAIVFTGGIGENAAPIRKQCCQGLEALGITVDDRKNEKAYEEVQTSETASVKIPGNRTTSVSTIDHHRHQEDKESYRLGGLSERTMSKTTM
jgi:acetate kinase